MPSDHRRQAKRPGRPPVPLVLQKPVMIFGATPCRDTLLDPKAVAGVIATLAARLANGRYADPCKRIAARRPALLAEQSAQRPFGDLIRDSPNGYPAAPRPP